MTKEQLTADLYSRLIDEKVWVSKIAKNVFRFHSTFNYLISKKIINYTYFSKISQIKWLTALLSDLNHNATRCKQNILQIIRYNNSIGNNNDKVNELFSLFLKFTALEKAQDQNVLCVEFDVIGSDDSTIRIILNMSSS